MKGTFRSYCSDQDATISWRGSKILYRGTIDAQHESEGIWWITRALVQPKKCCNQGIGSIMLQMLIKELKKYGAKKILVTPGGYDQETEKQFRFYEKNGFVPPIPEETEFYQSARIYYFK
jgi:GNAT superfamily N-acetyltransferase